MLWAPRGSHDNDTQHDTPAQHHGREDKTGIDVYDSCHARALYYIVGKFVGNPKLAT